MSAIGLRVGPFEIYDEAEIPGSTSWYRARRTGMTRRQPNEVLVHLLGPTPSSRELAAGPRRFNAIRAVDDPRFPRPVALYEGSGALAVAAPLGGPLTEIVTGRLLNDVAMKPGTLLDITLEITEGLLHAHNRGVIHGHLAPDMITLSKRGDIVIWDIGQPLTRPDYPWLAPERARGEPVTHATDQWSLGALIVALVTGRAPWAASDAESDPRTGNIQSYTEILARQWPALGRLVRQMMAPNPVNRHASLHAVRLELLKLSRQAGGTSDRRALAVWLKQRMDALRAVEDPSSVPDVYPEPAPGRALPTQPPSDPGITTDATPELSQAAPVKTVTEPEEDAPIVIAAEAADEITEEEPAAPSVVEESPIQDEAPLPEEAAPPALEIPAAKAQVVQTPVAVERDVAVDPPSAADALTEFAPIPMPTELAEEFMPTEMAGDAHDSDGPSLPDVPPIRAQAVPIASPAATIVPEPEPDTSAEAEMDAQEPALAEPIAPAAPAAAHVEEDEPVPTIPEMEIPETPERDDRLIVTVSLLDDEDDDAFEAMAPISREGTPVPLADQRVPLDLLAGPYATDPEADLHDVTADAADTSWATKLQSLANEQVVPVLNDLVANTTWPWEVSAQDEDAPYRAEPAVKYAPYVASAAVAGLALLLVVNVLL